MPGLEYIAELISRPLLALTAGDIGAEANDVDYNLQKAFRRGQDWNAVVLLDEAVSSFLHSTY